MRKSLLGKIAKGIVIAFIPVITMFSSPKAKAQTFTINPFAQPNDTTLAYYGSGDLDSNNVLEQNDLYLMSSKIGPTDQADIDGDGASFTSEDYSLLFEHINNGSLLPQNNWANPNLTSEQRKDWIKKMLVIDKTNEIPPVQSYWMCGQYSTQTIINFHGFPELKDSTIASKFPKYTLENHARFNLPVYNVSISWGEPIGHFINAILIGDDPLNFYDFYFFDVSRNDKEVIPGDVLMPENSKVKVNYIKFFSDGSIARSSFIKFQLNNEIPNLTDYYSGLILERPQVNIVSDLETIANNFKLNQNYPSPFNSQTKIKYFLPVDDKVSLNVYNLKGNLVETLVNKKQRAGEYQVDLNASNLSSGIYFYRLETSAGVKNKKMMLVK